MTAPALLKLAILDVEDLDVLSAHLQHAVLRVGDIRYRPRERRFVLVVDRFVRELPSDGETPEQRRMGLHFEGVRAVRSRRLDRSRPEGLLQLLAIRFTPTDPPSGVIDLVFAGDKDVRLEVEMLEAAASDLGPARDLPRYPAHPADDG